MVSEQSNPMGPPTVAQRVELIEEKLTDLDEAVKGMVSTAVEKAMEAMRQSLTEALMEGQSLAAKRLGTEIDAVASRLEGRISRSREY